MIPFLDDMTFLTKKGKDFQDFKVICRVMHSGEYINDEIKRIILKLSYIMNNYRLYTNTAPASSISKTGGFRKIDKRDKLFSAVPTVEHLYDGRVREISSGKILHQQTSCVYEIRKLDGEVFIANTISKTGGFRKMEAASIVEVYPDTLSKYLDVKAQDSIEHWVRLNNYDIRRVDIFNLNPIA